MTALAFANTTLRTAQICAASAFTTLYPDTLHDRPSRPGPSTLQGPTRTFPFAPKRVHLHVQPPRIPHSATR